MALLAFLSGRFGIASLLAVTLALASSSAAFGSPQPQIVVRFEVASNTIKDALPAAGGTAAIERTLSMYLARQLQAQFPFVAWMERENPAAPVLGRLVARLVDDTNDPMSSISVHWFAMRPSDAAPQPLLLAPIEVYRRNDPSVATDAATLQRDTQRALDRVALVALSEAGFMREFFTNFVTTIALASKVTPIPALHVIELPMRPDELPIGQESEMKVEFRKGNAGQTQLGLLKLSRFAPSSSGHLAGGVDKAFVNSSELPLTNNWHPTIPDLLLGTTVQCFLISYHPDRLPPIVTVPQ